MQLSLDYRWERYSLIEFQSTAKRAARDRPHITILINKLDQIEYLTLPTRPEQPESQVSRNDSAPNASLNHLRG